MRLLALAIVCGACSLLGGLAHANTYSSRQYYGEWKYNHKKAYHYRYYYHKPTKDYYGWKHHYVTYSPKVSRKYYYYYNPYSKKYWGRVPTECDGTPKYEILKEEDRKPELSEIPEAAFNKMDKMPVIPDAKDMVPMDRPPDDTPPAVVD